jgi:hypothetical protein
VLCCDSPVTKRQHTFFGDDEARPLIEFLNSGQGPRAVVETFIAISNARKPDLQRAAEAYQAVERLVPKGGTIFPDFEHLEPPRTPEIHQGRVRWTQRRAPEQIDPKTVPQEVWFSLMTLADLDLLSRVRRCVQSGCRRWFFAKFGSQRACSTECQRAALHASPRYKKERSTYMKGYRKREKIREARERTRGSGQGQSKPKGGDSHGDF